MAYLEGKRAGFIPTLVGRPANGRWFRVSHVYIPQLSLLLPNGTLKTLLPFLIIWRRREKGVHRWSHMLSVWQNDGSHSGLLAIPLCEEGELKREYGQAWWFISVIPALRRLKQEGCRFQGSLNYIVSSKPGGGKWWDFLLPHFPMLQWGVRNERGRKSMLTYIRSVGITINDVWNLDSNYSNSVINVWIL